MKTISERNRILNEVKDNCYLAFFDGNPEEGGKEILTGRKKVNFPVATNGYVKSTNQLDFTGGEEVFGNATGVAKYWGVYDSEVGGKLLYYFILPYEVRIVKDSTITIKAGNCVLKEG